MRAVHGRSAAAATPAKARTGLVARRAGWVATAQRSSVVAGAASGCATTLG